MNTHFTPLYICIINLAKIHISLKCDNTHKHVILKTDLIIYIEDVHLHLPKAVLKIINALQHKTGMHTLAEYIVKERI
ncbi:hypothetical protein Q765_04160 [Flavobacterium rivuli WB 3.3-2 = DSM 21788]|uniref:Uncharacterized protein n=1 Tax=Flavobacterium rivuli WB 3.3-2 = DSM 21788 TaxID=1121895 RepID=A0A0A2MIV7_9FLAO|nr:hypothetical protein Q765_04160 [Flavobacterium rivuli WB 3.3-2 = DSM 21788]